VLSSSVEETPDELTDSTLIEGEALFVAQLSQPRPKLLKQLGILIGNNKSYNNEKDN
jgi:hypothetical protein